MDNFDFFIRNIQKALCNGLPGKEAHRKMANLNMLHALLEDNTGINARESSVLILIYPFNKEPYIVFIKRPEYKGVHSGQISFPGGKHQPGDTTLIDTALREAAEETGLEKKEVKVLGKLTELYIPASNHNVLPILACAGFRPAFKMDRAEVEQILEFPLKKIMEPDVMQFKEVHARTKIPMRVPCYYIDGQIIWGATAMILSEVLEIYRNSISL